MASSQLLLDRYQILGQAGAGGFGTVQHAYDTRLARDVAIKCIALTEAEQAEVQLAELEGRMAAQDTSLLDESPIPISLPGLDEARAAAQLSDPHIVTVYDFEIHEGVAYIIMEYIEGLTLGDLMEELGDAITLDQIATIVGSIASALTAAHKVGVLHLDVKPDNVLIDRSGTVKVTDFGLAALVDGSGSGTTGGGTIGYMPLEQIRREPLDERTDEWALATIAYTLLTGVNPFEVAGSLKEAEQALLKPALTRPSLYWDPFDEDLDNLLFKALSPSKTHRFPSVKAFYSQLKPWLGSNKAGQAQLQEVLWLDEATDEFVTGREAIPLVDRIGERGAAVIMRIGCALSLAVLMLVALGNGNVAGITAFGLFLDTPWIYGIVLTTTFVLGLLAPAIMTLVILVGFGVSFVFSGNLVLAGVIAGAAILWWAIIGRKGLAQTFCGLLQPLCGALGFAAIAPIVSGVLLRPGAAMLSSLFAIVLGAVFSSSGSASLMGWNLMAFNRLSLGGSMTLTTIEMPFTWCVALSWVLATLALSILGSRQIAHGAVIGAFIGCGLLIAGVCVGTWFESSQVTALPSVVYFIGALIPGVLGIIFAILGVNRKAQESRDE